MCEYRVKSRCDGRERFRNTEVKVGREHAMEMKAAEGIGRIQGPLGAASQSWTSK